MTMIGVVKSVDNPRVTFGEYNGARNFMPVYKDGKEVGYVKGASFGWEYVSVSGPGRELTYIRLHKLKTHLQETL